MLLSFSLIFFFASSISRDNCEIFRFKISFSFIRVVTGGETAFDNSSFIFDID